MVSNMTVTATPRKAGPYTGTGSAASLPFAFKVFAVADLLVTRNDTPLALGADYTVTLNADQDNSPGGAVNMVAAAYPLGSTVWVETNITAEQQSSIPNLRSEEPSCRERV